MNIRGKSVGETVDLNITCPDDGTTVVPITLNLDDIKVQRSEDHEQVLKLTDDVAIAMKYPSMDLFIKNNLKDSNNTTQVEDVFEIASMCIDQIIEGEEVYVASNFSKKELFEFLEGMDTKQFQKLQNFFETMPKLSHTVTVTNPNTGNDNEVVIEGLANFFA